MRIEGTNASYDMELKQQDGSCDIRFLCSSMRIEANNASSYIELKIQDLETQVERHEEISKFEEGVEKSPWVN